jgi:predicted unusual protein kinase regulating ubiquinone biosynthesis (AarF/ABC1/UbiB family)
MLQLDQETMNTLIEARRRRDRGETRNGRSDYARWWNARERSGPQQQDAPFDQNRESDTSISQRALLSAPVKVSSLRTLWRLLRLLSVAAYFCLGVLWHKLSRKPAVERHKLDAVMFRRLLERLGGVLIKVGQQMSQRTDLLPPAYCDELRNLLDELPDKIDRADVEAAVERQMRRPLADVFADFVFDPVVGSASVACVYEAYLHTGEKVAVKIRRPGIYKSFTADLNALAWILRFAEFLTIWRPGMFESFRSDLKTLLLEELDFRIEARYQELFRRYHKRRKKLRVTAPKVYHDLSGEEVMVSEFVSGHWVKDIIAAMDSGDEEYLEELRSLDIEPRKVAKRLLRSQHYSFHECPLFHGDPHAANILVQPNSKIVMVDFGACGVFSERDRNLMWQLNYYYSVEDVGGMVNMVISLMEPIPHRPITQFRRELLDAWWLGFYGIKSKHAEWWERTSVRLWLKFFELIRKHQIPVPRNMLRMIRATLSYDTVAARLDSRINVFKEFEKYSQGVARRARCQIEEGAIRQLLLGPDDATFLKLKQIATVGNGLLYRLQKFVNEPSFSLSAVASKVYSAIRSFVRMFLLAGAWTVAGLVLLVAFHKDGLRIISEPYQYLWSSWELDDLGNLVILHPEQWDVTGDYGNGFLQIVALVWFVLTSVSVIVYARRIYLRFGDTDD